jgi:geranylgeranyl pyrophosphate synthase
MTRVVILGGGVAGMSAAQELIERGFEVVVLERRPIAGGKARSVPVSDDGVGRMGHELPDLGVDFIGHHLPGEHGFRFFPGFYKHIVDTMRRIPSFDGRQVADHLVPTTRVGITQYDQPDFVVPAQFPRSPGDVGTLLRDLLLAFGPETGLTPDDLAFFGARIWQILSSSPERRLGEYEGTGWWDFVGADARSPAYQKFLAAGITRSLVAAKARTASTRTIGDVFVQLMLTIVNPTAGSTDRVLDGPTNLVWIDPWLEHLKSLGVDYVMEAEVKQILCQNGRISGVLIEAPDGQRVVQGDHYIAAIPLERIAPMVDRHLLAADPALANLPTLAPNVEWMNGAQYFLRREVPTPHGHVIHIDTPWALTSISQLQFWRSVASEQFGSSDVRGILSVDISDWTLPGGNGLPAMQCSREEVIAETWRQLKLSMNTYSEVLRDEDLHSWFLDSDIQPDPNRPGWLQNSEPLLVNLVNTWALRPEAITAIPNFWLASDYVRTHTDLATMEGANEAARRAVNGLLDSVGFTGERCAVWPLHEPEILAPFRAHDAVRYQAGLPWDDSQMQYLAMALKGASPLLAQASGLVSGISPFIAPVATALEATTGVMAGVVKTFHLDPLVKAHSDYVATPETTVLDVVPGASAAFGPAGFMDRLGWYREQLTDTLLSGTQAVEPQRHLYGLISEFVGPTAGKGLRAALCLAATGALGGDRNAALPLASGIEMLHNAFLVHDDIEDGSDLRRGVPTMHQRVGTPLAINTGDAMNALAMRLIRRGAEPLGPLVALRILDEADHMVMESLEGQAMELGWVKDNDLSVTTDDYLRLVLKKTAWYSFMHPLRIGALAANGNDQNLQRFDRYGYLLGLAFQITDDVLNLRGNASRYGKEIDGDLLEGKRTLILTHAYEHADARDRRWVEQFLSRPRTARLPREVLRLRQIINHNGSIDWAAEVANALADAAALEFEHNAFAKAAPSADLDWLRALGPFMVKRDL